MTESALIRKVAHSAKSLASHSWEYGAVTQALLEVYNRDLSIFGTKRTSREPVLAGEVEGLEYAERFIRTAGDTLIDGEGSAADPASLGVAALMLRRNNPAYADAAKRQLNVLMHDTPRLSNGAISHRAKVSEAWSDFAYMVPPFIAYYGLVSGTNTTISEAAKQIMLYNDILNDGSTGLWRHILGPETEDQGVWSTGNGWSATGITRVLATIDKASGDQAQELTHWRGKLVQVVKAVIDGAMQCDRDANTALLRNYLPDKTWFGEAAGTAALAAAVFRLAVLEAEVFGKDTYISWAEESREAVMRCINVETGVVSPVVNPMDWKDRKPHSESAEGQCFVMLLFAARRDWTDWKERGPDESL